jgi:chorismate mutase
MALRGIRGATTVTADTRDEILNKTGEMLETIIERNAIQVEDVASAIFSVTADLKSEFPAVAARKLGWIHTPLICTNEIDVTGSLKSCIRVLLHVNTDRSQDQIFHVYLHEAKKLRPDLEFDNKEHSSFIS